MSHIYEAKITLEGECQRAWDEAIEAAACILDDWELGTLEMVHSGDASMGEIREELRKLRAIKRDILRLKMKVEKGLS